jgi:hypothetical protein
MWRVRHSGQVRRVIHVFKVNNILPSVGVTKTWATPPARASLRMSHNPYGGSSASVPWSNASSPLVYVVLFIMTKYVIVAGFAIDSEFGS